MTEPAQPSRVPGSPITKFRTSDHWAVSLFRDILLVVLIVAGIAIALYLICGAWPAVVTVESGSMIPHMNIGDLVVVVEKDRFDDLRTWEDGKASGYRTFGDYGDIIIYRPNGYIDFWAKIGLLPFSGQRPIIHRAMTWTEAGAPLPLYRDGYDITTGTATMHEGYVTKGDNNRASDQGASLMSIGTIEPVKKEWVVGKALFAIPLVGLLPLYIREVIVVVIVLLVLSELYLRRKEQPAAEKPGKKGAKTRR
jgi:signal peptidase